VPLTTRFVVGDSVGEMAAYYLACDVAFVGGSLVPLGGQNLIEACAAGAPVIVGPSTYNFADAAKLAIDAGAALRVANAKELVDTVAALLSNDDKRRMMSNAGRVFADAHRGAAERVAQVIEDVIDGMGSDSN
jgi:3-deoxy-D-manno-octulosonic-acid transferase